MDNYAFVRKTAHIVAKVTVLLGSPDFRRLDEYCRRRGFKKSTLIARLIREHLDMEGFDVQTELPLDASEGRRARPVDG